MRRRYYNRNNNQYDNDRYERGEGRNETRRYGRGYDRGNSENEGSYSGGYPSDFDSDTGGDYFGGGMRYGEGYSSGSDFGGFRGSSSENDRNYDRSSGYNRDNENYGQNNNRRGGSYGQQGSYSGQGYDRDYDRQNRNLGSARSDYGDYAYGGRLNDEGMENDRGWMDKASDEVSSWFGDDDAERRRRMDQQSHRGKGPKNYTRSDDRIKEDVNDRLSDSHYLDASDIEVSVDGGEVTLSGTVNSRSDKRRAEDLADSVSGVNHTQNNLRVSQSSWSSSSNQSTTGTDTSTTTSTIGKTGNNKSKSAST